MTGARGGFGTVIMLDTTVRRVVDAGVVIVISNADLSAGRERHAAADEDPVAAIAWKILMGRVLYSGVMRITAELVLAFSFVTLAGLSE